jgi:hypothetical protein
MNMEVLSPMTMPVMRLREPSSTLDIVVLFADGAAGRRATELHRRLARRLGPGWALRCSCWQFDSLSASSLRAADGADLLMIAAHADQALPPAVLAWFDQALVEGARGRALVALLDGWSAGPNPATAAGAQLRAQAARAGMMFIAHWTDRTDADEDSIFGDLEQRTNTLTPTLREILSFPHSTPRWGINE